MQIYTCIFCIMMQHFDFKSCIAGIILYMCPASQWVMMLHCNIIFHWLGTSLRCEQNGCHFADNIFKCILCISSLFMEFNWQNISIGSANSLAIKRHQAIAWTNVNAYMTYWIYDMQVRYCMASIYILYLIQWPHTWSNGHVFYSHLVIKMSDPIS